MLTRLRAVLHHLNHAKMSTKSGVYNTNTACCTLPPVRSDYKEKGFYKAYGGFDKVYVAGPEEPGKLVLVCVFDIFGFKPQTLQGADILAEELKAQVLMPDFLKAIRLGTWTTSLLRQTRAKRSCKSGSKDLQAQRTMCPNWLRLAKHLNPTVWISLWHMDIAGAERSS